MPSNGDWGSVCYGDGKFVAVTYNDNKAAYSTDGITWTQTTMPASAKWLSLCYGDGKFVTVTYGSDIAAYSTDGVNWTQTTMPASVNWSPVCYGDGKFVAVAQSSNIAAYSTDGINWTQTTMPASVAWSSVCYGNGKFVTAAAQNNSNIAAYSTDGINWTQTTMPVYGSWFVCYGNGKFVAVTYESNIAAYSTDGINWTQTTMPDRANWQSVCHGAGKFVAVAYESNKAAYSTDGINWTQTTMPASKSWSSVCYGNDKFVAVAQSSNIAAYSTDGVVWADRYVFKYLQNSSGEDISEDVKSALDISADDVGADYVGAAVAAVSEHNSNADAHADKFAAVNAAIGNLTPSACKVTLTASGWDSTAKTQSAMVPGVLEDESKQLIMPMPVGTSMSAYNEAGIQMTAQAANTVTFTADTVPKVDVEVWVVVQAVNDVTPPPPLDQASWDYISKQSLAGNAKNIWAVGDCKAVKLSGTVSDITLNTTLYVYILDFDHDKSSANGAKDGITFGTFKTFSYRGLDVALGPSGYGDFGTELYMNTTATNSGGWKNSDMRYGILGSTNTQNGDATATTATSPKANTLMNCLPSDLRAVMRPMYIYTDNTGGGSDTASYVTGTLDYLPLLAEYEVHGTRKYANSAEQNNQTQYAYYKNGNSKKKVNYFDDASSEVSWWVRSPSYDNSDHFCIVSSNGSTDSNHVLLSFGVAPAFKV